MSEVKKSVSKPKKGGYKVLLVEDEKSIAEMYTTKFAKEESIEIVHIDNGGEVIDVVRRESPHMILLDIILPQEDGFSILEKIRRDKKIAKTPVVFLTNLGQDEDRQKGQQLGADEYLVKSRYNPSEVLERVKEILQGKKEKKK
jgi:DNA-binding response OmpR family regulator